MKKGFPFFAFILMVVLPLPFGWYGYGEKGIYGYAMLQNLFFLCGWGMTILSFICYKNKMRAFRGIGSAMVVWSYFYTAIDFCRHLPFDYSPIDACKMPMWISLSGSIGVILYFWFCFERKSDKEENRCS